MWKQKIKNPNLKVTAIPKNDFYASISNAQVEETPKLKHQRDFPFLFSQADESQECSKEGQIKKFGLRKQVSVATYLPTM